LILIPTSNFFNKDCQVNDDEPLKANLKESECQLGLGPIVIKEILDYFKSVRMDHKQDFFLVGDEFKLPLKKVFLIGNSKHIQLKLNIVEENDVFEFKRS
jgi:hypothetical protein